MAQDLDLLLEKACSTTQGSLKATFILSELEKLAPAFQDESTRGAAEEALTQWSDLGGDPLRKGMAMAWLARARASIAPHVADALSGATSGVRAVRNAAGAVKAGAQRAKGAVTGAYDRAQGAVENVGAAAGEKLANSKLNAGRMAQVRARGGAEAQARMADRLRPQGRVEPFMEHEAAGPRLEPSAAPANAHSEALASAFRQGADHAAHMHAKNAAHIGRVSARHAFKAGAMLGAAGAATAAVGAVAGRMSQAEHDQRVEAGKHSHDRRPGGFAKAAEADELEKGTLREDASKGLKVGAGIGGALGVAGGALHGVARNAAIGSGLSHGVAAAAGAVGGGIGGAIKGAIIGTGIGVGVNLLRGDTPKEKPAVAPHVQRMVAMNAPKTPKGAVR